MAIEMLVGLNVINDREYQRYRDEIALILKDHGGGFGYDFKVAEVLRSRTNEPINRVFTIFFPDEATMESFFANEAYVAVKEKHFEKSVTHKTIIAKWNIASCHQALP